MVTLSHCRRSPLSIPTCLAQHWNRYQAEPAYKIGTDAVNVLLLCVFQWNFSKWAMHSDIPAPDSWALWQQCGNQGWACTTLGFLQTQAATDLGHLAGVVEENGTHN